MSTPPSKHHWSNDWQIDAIMLAFLIGLGVQLLIDAVWVFLVPHDPSFAAKLGPAGAFYLSSVFFSFCYLGVFLAVTLPLFSVRHRLWWFDSARHRLPVGGWHFALASFVVLFCLTSSSAEEIAWLTVKSFVIGYCSFIPLGPR